MCVNKVSNMKILRYIVSSQRARPSKMYWTGQCADNVVKKGQENVKNQYCQYDGQSIQ